ncbi:MAG: hypothetical protein HC831_19030 [Chloroflexia bacterium]|nr:hypothetical protein [Chloroflexia bacterium]
MKIKEIKKITAFQEDHSISEIHVVDLIPTTMRGVRISDRNGEHYLQIPSNMDRIRWKNWINTPGGILSKDFLAWLREKEDKEAKYFLLQGETVNTVIRLLENDDDLLIRYQSLGLINGKIKDSYYMHLMTLPVGESFHSGDRYIEEIVNSEDDGKSKDIEDDIESSYTSEPLFE